MKSIAIRRAATAMMAAALVLTAPGIGMAGSLAGSVGDKRFSPVLPSSLKDPCNKAYKAYIAASGHSAYATTGFIRVMDGYVLCGAKYNAPSQQAAEDLAMKSCQSGLAHYKVAAGSQCQIAASK